VTLLPIFPGQLERWQKPRPEPVVLELPDWTVERVTEPDDTFPNERTITWRRGDATVSLLRYWDQPRHPGGPMEIATKRTIVVGQRELELVTTRAFQGQVKEVRAVWITGTGHGVEYGVRLVFDRCTDAELADVLARVDLRW
jgi:hypothetical protein